MGLAVIITLCVNIVITMIVLAVFLHYYNASYQCEAYPSFWCRTDWKCPGFSPTDDSTAVMYNAYGQGITNANLEGYILATMGLEQPSGSNYKYADGTPITSKSMVGSVDFPDKNLGPCSQSWSDGTLKACQDPTSGDTGPVPTDPSGGGDPLGCQCGPPITPEGYLSGMCISSNSTNAYSNCTFTYDSNGNKQISDYSSCKNPTDVNSCVARYERVCNTTGFALANSACGLTSPS